MLPRQTGHARTVPTAAECGGAQAVPRQRSGGHRALFSLQGGERRRAAGRASGTVTASTSPGWGGGTEPGAPGPGVRPPARCPFKSAPPKMSPRVHVLALPNLLVLPDPRLGLRAAAIGWQRGAAPSDWWRRAAPPRPCPAGCAAGGAGQVAAMAAAV